MASDLVGFFPDTNLVMLVRQHFFCNIRVLHIRHVQIGVALILKYHATARTFDCADNGYELTKQAITILATHVYHLFAAILAFFLASASTFPALPGIV